VKRFRSSQRLEHGLVHRNVIVPARAGCWSGWRSSATVIRENTIERELPKLESACMTIVTVRAP
jgi:hypothetical protein